MIFSNRTLCVVFVAIGIKRWMALVGLDLVNSEVAAPKSEVVMDSTWLVFRQVLCAAAAA